ncbi:MAG: SGNH/GDSL hydrolase family protein [Gracilimonas sp.]|uniref:SGNH/GDSL hydrolase family protein n=1 Tax=Gracilimonas sp. TaxID=1974203 RepID=UPI001B12626E|nr:GDSL-type esterase/lipase family protein [Gracilimonas sp.]MBO6587437.1 SGNH/GDSL hydrolase family protein [Gracilimonas sp.]MBO6617064.1 SGNH/GDSL hydrolase family protein [Gracilimonas sp.]
MANKKATDEEKGILEQFMLPFYHITKRIPLFPGKNDVKSEAGLFGITEEELKEYRENYDENARQAALEILKEDEIVDCLDKLPMDGDETIVAFGDSNTEDAQGWFTILKHVLEISVEKANFNFINAGVSYNTTAEALRRVDRDVVVHEPDWVIVALGTFDAQRLNIAPDRTLLPLSETWENIETIQSVLESRVENPLIWITPAPVIDEMLEENLLYDFTIKPEDLGPVQDLVSGKQGAIVDASAKRMGEGEPNAWNYLPDGLHHSLSGHMETTKAIIKKLAEPKN